MSVINCNTATVATQSIAYIVPRASELLALRLRTLGRSTGAEPGIYFGGEFTQFIKHIFYTIPSVCLHSPGSRESLAESCVCRAGISHWLLRHWRVLAPQQPGESWHI